MTFRFSLAALLRLRATRERVEERTLLSLRQEARRFEAAVEQTIAARREQRRRRTAPLPGAAGLDAVPRVAGSSEAGSTKTGSAETGLTGAVLQFSDFLEARLELEEQHLRQQLVAKQEEASRQLAVLMTARRQREVMESLRDRELSVYREEERRRDQRRLDDLFLLQLLLARRTRPHG